MSGHGITWSLSIYQEPMGRNRFLKGIILLGTLLLALSSPIRAEDVTLNFTPSHKDSVTGGPAVETGFKIYYGTSPGNLNQIQTVSGSALSTIIPNLGAGTWYFAMTGLDGTGEGPRTNLATKVVNPALRTANTTAYKQTLGVNGFVMKPVGTVPLGLACDPSHAVDGLNLLPDRNKVTYPSNAIMPTSVYALCTLQ